MATARGPETDADANASNFTKYVERHDLLQDEKRANLPSPTLESAGPSNIILPKANMFTSSPIDLSIPDVLEEDPNSQNYGTPKISSSDPTPRNSPQDINNTLSGSAICYSHTSAAPCPGLSIDKPQQIAPLMAPSPPHQLYPGDCRAGLLTHPLSLNSRRKEKPDSGQGDLIRYHDRATCTFTDDMFRFGHKDESNGTKMNSCDELDGSGGASFPCFRQRRQSSSDVLNSMGLSPVSDTFENFLERDVAISTEYNRLMPSSDGSSQSDSSGSQPQYRTPFSTPEKDRSHPTDTILRRMPRPAYPVSMSDSGPRPFCWETQQKWMKWEQSCVRGVRPRWRVEPDLALIKETVKDALEHLPFKGEISVLFLSAGGFHNVYTVTVSNSMAEAIREFIFRVPLPIDPYYKTESDVATTELVRHFTSIPVPVIYAYDSSSHNKLGLEWILMEKVAGTSAFLTWLDLDNEAHIRITRQVATWQNELAGLTSRFLGGVYLRWKPTEVEFFVGPSTESYFVTNRRLLYGSSRGPFDSKFAFYDAMIDVYLKELGDPVIQALYENYVIEETGSAEPCPDDDFEAYERELILSYAIPAQDRENWQEEGPHSSRDIKTDLGAVMQALRDALPIIQPADTNEEFLTILQHDDISTSNLMIDDQCNLVALLDWESIDLKPLSCLLPYPTFLDLDSRPEERWSRHHLPRSAQTRERYANPDSTDWDSIRRLWEEKVATHLKRYYKERLEELSSPLLKLFESEKDSDGETSFENDLRAKIAEPHLYGSSLRGMDRVSARVGCRRGLG